MGLHGFYTAFSRVKHRALHLLNRQGKPVKYPKLNLMLKMAGKGRERVNHAVGKEKEREGEGESERGIGSDWATGSKE